MNTTNVNSTTPERDMANGAFWAFFCVYSVYQTWIFMHYQAMVPDEYWFLKEVKTFSIFSRSAPPLDYGSLFWLLLKVLHFPLLIRAVFLLLFLSIPYLLLSVLTNPFTRLIGLMVYLSFPYAFWTGKLISPEILYLAVMSFALLYSNKNISLSGICAGIATGIKINALPILAFLILIKLNDKPIQHGTRLGICFLIGLIISNPINLDLYFVHILQANKTTYSILEWSVFRAYFLEPLWSWDNVLLRSFSQMLCHPLLFLGFLLVIVAGSRIIGGALFIFAISTAYMVVNSQFAFAWYWFALVPVMLYTLKAIDSASTDDIFSLSLKFSLPENHLKKLPACVLKCKQYGLLCLVLLFAFCNFLLNLPYTIFQAYEKFAQIQFIENYSQDCVARAFNSYQPEDIINKMEFGYGLPRPDFGFALPTIPANTVVLSHYDSSINPNRKTMILIGRRMIANPFNLSTMLPKNYPIKLYDLCGDLFIFVNQ